MKTKLSLIIISLFVFMTNQNAALPLGYVEHYIDDIRYGIFVPTNYDAGKKYSLIIFLHGYSDLTSWDLEYYHDLFQNKYPAIILTPKCPTSLSDGWGNSWNTPNSHAIVKTYKLIDSIKTTYNIDTTKMYIHGTSMGGYGTLNVLASKPSMFAAGYVVCGGGNTETAYNVMQTPLWIFHGSDDPTVPVSYAREMYFELLSLGDKNVRYTEYPGVGHDSWNNVALETTLTTWMMSQVKGSTHNVSPDSISNLEYSIENNNNVRLQWQKPNNDSCLDKTVWYYKVYRDEKLIASVNEANNTKYTDEQTNADTTYKYQIVAVNYFFNESEISSQLLVTIPSLPTFAENISYLNKQFEIYPNPIKTNATIKFENKSTGNISIKIYNLLGHEIQTLTNEVYISGSHSIPFNKGVLSKGIYLLVMRTHEFSKTIRFTVY